MRLRPGLVVDVAVGVSLDLDEPVDVDVGPVCALGIPTMRVPLGPPSVSVFVIGSLAASWPPGPSVPSVSVFVILLVLPICM